MQATHTGDSYITLELVQSHCEGRQHKATVIPTPESKVQTIFANFFVEGYTTGGFYFPTVWWKEFSGLNEYSPI